MNVKLARECDTCGHLSPIDSCDCELCSKSIVSECTISQVIDPIEVLEEIIGVIVDDLDEGSLLDRKIAEVLRLVGLRYNKQFWVLEKLEDELQ